MPVYTEPEWGEPQEAIEGCSAITTTSPIALVMQGYIQRLLEYHFHDYRNIHDPLLRQLCSSPSSNCTEPCANEQGTTSIWIGSSYSTNVESIQRTPAIYVKRGPINLNEQTLRNIILTTAKNGERHNVLVRGSHSLICKADTGAAAESLGQEVMMRMLHYSSIIQDDAKLGKFRVTSLSEVKEMDEEAEAQTGFYTVVQIEWMYVYLWEIRNEAPFIKRTQMLYDFCK
jgi:hypothetical protein